MISKTLDNLENIIEYENENTYLDFKQSFYSNNFDLLKDVMSMANGSFGQRSLILIGIKSSPGLQNQIVGIDRIADQADLENLIQANIEPHINFSYSGFHYKDKLLGIIEISDNHNPPYMMKKKYLTLEIGECWIRKGSKQSRATREDFDRLYLLREKYISNHSVRFGFGNDFSNEILYNIPKVDIENSPSSVKKLKLEALLLKLRAFIEDEEKSIKKPQINRFGLPQMAGIFSSSYGDYDPSKKAIMSGYNDLGLPFFCTEDDLIKRIDNCTETYYKDDLHYYLEVNSQKQNFFMLNESNMFLEDAEVKLWYPKSAFVVADRVYKEPVHLSIFEKMNMQPDYENTRYPLVSENEDSFLVEQSHASIRHKEITSLFEIDLRIYVKNDAEGVYPISYQISAKNLPNPIKGELRIVVERPGKK